MKCIIVLCRTEEKGEVIMHGWAEIYLNVKHYLKVMKSLAIIANNILVQYIGSVSPVLAKS